LGAAAFAASCGGPAPPPPKKSVPTPAATLYTLKLAYNAPDFEAYAALFSPGEFEARVENPPDRFPERWGYDEEMEASRALFADAFHIVFEMVTKDEAVGVPREGATSFSSLPMDVRIRVWREPTFCFYARGDVIFDFGREDADAPWLIVGLTDKTGSGSPRVLENEQTEACSWAEIKHYYLRQARKSDAKP
jgi:hypothetical protein